MDEIRNLNDSFSKLEADVKIAKNIDNLLSQRVVDLERQCWANAQYLSRECLEIVGIPCSVDDHSMEEKVIRLFRFSKKLVATLTLATLKCVTVSPKRMTELL